MTHSTFVARQQELAQLDQFLDRTLAGEGQVSFVTGMPAAANPPIKMTKT